MKKLILIVFFITNFSCLVELRSQDTNIVKYLPLKVGNIWIYNSGFGRAVKIKITGTMNANGHTYFVFEQTGSLCICATNTYSPFLTSLQPLRVDSTSGNLMIYGNSCNGQSNEHLLDSLKSRIGDSGRTCYIYPCLDTTSQNIFGTMTKTKNLGFASFYSTTRRYAYKLGMMHSYQGCPLNITCNYTLTGCVIDGVVNGDTGFVVGINKISDEIPNNFSLSQNYPNPFNPITNIKFQIANSSDAKLIIYDALGKEVETLIDKKLEPGEYEANFDGMNLPSGIYYYKLETGDFTETKKMVLIK